MDSLAKFHEESNAKKHALTVFCSLLDHDDDWSSFKVEITEFPLIPLGTNYHSICSPHTSV